MNGIGAGRKDQEVELQSRSRSIGAVGQNEGAWSTYATVWARARTARPRDVLAAGQLQQVFDVVFTIDWRADVTGSHRVLWNGVPHEIIGQPGDPDGRRVHLELMTVAGLASGR